MRKPLKAGLIYFAVVFGFGFLFGAIRTLWIVPHIGARTAELMETPFMIAISFFAAQKIVKRYLMPFSAGNRIIMGIFAVGLMLCAEFTLVLYLRGLSLEQYFATRDPVAGAAYYFALLLFALAPSVAERCNGDLHSNV